MQLVHGGLVIIIISCRAVVEARGNRTPNGWFDKTPAAPATPTMSAKFTLAKTSKKLLKKS